jgi:hypothetical protein
MCTYRDGIYPIQSFTVFNQVVETRPSPISAQEAVQFRLRDDCPLWCVVPHASTTTRLGNSCRAGHDPGGRPTTPVVSLIRVTISLAEASEYYHVRHPIRICQYQIYLHALTLHSVAGRTFHFSVTPSNLLQVLEY